MRDIPPGKELNRPTPAGRKMGAHLARLTDEAEIEKRKQFPNMPERCSSCAFRGGTIPNGCEETVMDALKSVLELHPFMCHMDLDADGQPTEICAGWMVLMTGDRKPAKAPWPYSNECDV